MDNALRNTVGDLTTSRPSKSQSSKTNVNKAHIVYMLDEAQVFGCQSPRATTLLLQIHDVIKVATKDPESCNSGTEPREMVPESTTLQGPKMA